MKEQIYSEGELKVEANIERIRFIAFVLFGSKEVFCEEMRRLGSASPYRLWNGTHPSRAEIFVLQYSGIYPHYLQQYFPPEVDALLANEHSILPLPIFDPYRGGAIRAKFQEYVSNQENHKALTKRVESYMRDIRFFRSLYAEALPSGFVYDSTSNTLHTPPTEKIIQDCLSQIEKMSIAERTDNIVQWICRSSWEIFQDFERAQKNHSIANS